MLQILSLQEAQEEDKRLAAELAAKSPPPPIQDDNVELHCSFLHTDPLRLQLPHLTVSACLCWSAAG